jgi:molybdopterin converting factor small subunit
MQVALYAALRQKVGSKYVDVATGVDSTIRDVLRDLTGRHPSLAEDVWSADGTCANVVRVFVNGVDVRHLQGTDTLVTSEDKIDIFTPVSGG